MIARLTTIYCTVVCFCILCVPIVCVCVYCGTDAYNSFVFSYRVHEMHRLQFHIFNRHCCLILCTIFMLEINLVLFNNLFSSFK